ncbi:alpha/beta-hydrolase [Cubamyces lactineus]|nr:alpha/beta-hydrolase [Cubamyces lactineus]
MLVSISIILLVGRLAEAATAGDVPSMDRGIHPTFHWSPCDPAIVEDPTISCSFFDIPLDYHDRSAGTGRIAVAKANATTERFGTLFINPGGPGGSGLAALDQLGSMVRGLTGGHYDLVGWDPRGVGPLTIPGDIVCFTNVEEYNTFWNGTIELTGIEMTGNFTDPHDINALLSQAPIMQKKYEELGKRCLQQPSGKYLKYVGTAAAVRDMVAMADALDGQESPINLFATSYGTVFGAWFINIGRIVLDGVLNPILLATEETTTFWPKQLMDADRVYDACVTGCALAGPHGCSIATQGQTPVEVDADIQALLQRAHGAARKNSSVPVTSADVRAQLGSILYSPDEWATFANVSYPAAVNAVDMETSGSLHAGAGKRRRFKRQSTSFDAVTYSGQAIECGDSVDPRGTTMSDVFRGIISSSRTASHLFSSVWPNPFGYCPFWPVRAVERYQGPFDKKLANKILVLSNTYDPITPVSGARALVELLGEGGTLVLLNGFGHTTVEPSQCLDEIISAYFVHGQHPGDNITMCEVDADYEIFTGINTGAILAALIP